jgi:tripartite-type tricarboxylate transporter receptor subunit TctC
MFHPDRRALLTGALAAASGLCLPVRAQPAFRPSRPVKLISPLLAGGATDAVIRPLAQRLSQLWNQPVVVENHPGAGTVIGTQLVVAAPPDGHTFGVAISALTINPSLRSNLPYDTFKDVAPITHIGNMTGALIAHPSFPASTVAGLIAHAKASPGSISWASLGVGTGGHITGELLCKRAGIDMVHVAFNGSSAAYRDILPGRVPIGFVVLESALPHLRAGKLKLIAFSDRHRNRLHPQVPTIAETVPEVGFEGVFGFIGPRGLPLEIANAVHADVASVLAQPDLRQRLQDQSMEIVGGSPTEFAQTIRREVDYWKVAVAESGAHVN